MRYKETNYLPIVGPNFIKCFAVNLPCCLKAEYIHGMLFRQKIFFNLHNIKTKVNTFKHNAGINISLYIIPT